jgi:3-polyprenyl-4-hydroxybenzoate decarboxylase
VDHLVFRILDQFAIPHSTATTWKGAETDGRSK